MPDIMPAAAFDNGRRKIARGLPLAGALVGELRVFQVRFTAKGLDTRVPAAIRNLSPEIACALMR